MSTSRRHLLFSGLSALGASLLGRGPASADQGAAAPHLIVVFVQGGWDTTYVLDPKPGLTSIDAPEGDVREVGGQTIFDHGSRPVTRAFFEAFGQVSTIVNGIQVQSINHPDCTKRMLTGTASELNADFAAIAAHEHGSALAAPYLAMGATAFSGDLGSITVRTGAATQITTLLDPLRAYPPRAADFVPFEPSAREVELIDRFHAQGLDAERSVRGALGKNRRRLADFEASRSRGAALAGAKRAFPEDFSFSLDMGVQIDIALRALSEGLSHTAKLEAGFGGWDTHENNVLQVDQNEQLFGSLSTLMGELESRPGKAAGNKMIDETLVVVVSEMGRTPKLNEVGGKDHWPVTSALLLGAGLPGGRVLGATGEGLESVPIDLATGLVKSSGNLLDYGSFAAGLLRALAVDPKQYLPRVEVFDAILG